jgi:Neocarzinostatin family/Carboxypeptidase regulatory-like domain
MGITRLRTPARAVLAVLTVAALAIPILLASPSQAQAFEPSVTPVPHEDLADGQQITVNGSGFEPDQPVSVSQCADVPHDGNPPCDMGDAVEVLADSTGNFSISFTVHNPMTSNVTGLATDCVVVQCYLAGSQNGVTAAHALFFHVGRGNLSGTVRDSNSQPLPGAGVTACLEPDTPSTGCSGFFAPSDDAGNYTIDLPVGTYNVGASLGGVRGPDVQAVVTEDQTTSLDLTVEFGTLSGTVRDSFGDPLPNIAVPICLAPTIPAPGLPGPGSSCTGFTFTNAAGVFTRNLAPGAYNIAAFHGPSGFMTRADATVTVVAGQTTTQNLTLPLGKVSGSVLDAAGQPIPGTVGFGACPAPGTDPSCPGVQFAIADAAGKYTLRLRSGTYNVVGFTNNGGVILSAATSITVETGEVITCNVQMPSTPVCRTSDDDGVPDEVEDNNPNGPDGNNDGFDDSRQANVTSLPNAVDSEYVTIGSPEGSTLADVTAIDPESLPPPPAGTELPAGVFSFEVRGLEAGEAATVDVFLPDGTESDSYLKFQNDVWLEFAGATITGNHVSLVLVDGGAGDGDGVANGVIVDPGAPAVSPFAFSGFFSPVDNLPTLNWVKAGQAVPVKFSLGGDQGLDIFAVGSPRSERIDCESSAPIDGVEETMTAGGSGLSYDATTDTYTYVWKTSKNWAPGTCRQLVLELSDGLHSANFKFK